MKMEKRWKDEGDDIFTSVTVVKKAKPKVKKVVKAKVKKNG